MLWIFVPTNTGAGNESGFLTFNEADLFLRAGEDMRAETWPEGQFVRVSAKKPISPAGYVVKKYKGSQSDKQAKWRRA